MLKTALAKLSPSDKPWDTHKSESIAVARIYAGNWAHVKKAGRMLLCSGVLLFGEIADESTGEVRFRLLKAHFCRVRYCPICQWRRSLLWRAKFYQALPGILAQHPTARFLFLTLTVENCPVENLRETLQHMGKAWGRFIKRKEFSSVIGWGTHYRGHAGTGKAGLCTSAFSCPSDGAGVLFWCWVCEAS